MANSWTLKKQRLERLASKQSGSRCPNGQAHHWLLAEPAGPAVTGSCRLCGAERIFPTTLPDDWISQVERT